MRMFSNPGRLLRPVIGIGAVTAFSLWSMRYFHLHYSQSLVEFSIAQVAVFFLGMELIFAPFKHQKVQTRLTVVAWCVVSALIAYLAQADTNTVIVHGHHIKFLPAFWSRLQPWIAIFGAAWALRKLSGTMSRPRSENPIGRPVGGDNGLYSPAGFNRNSSNFNDIRTNAAEAGITYSMMSRSDRDDERSYSRPPNAPQQRNDSQPRRADGPEDSGSQAYYDQRAQEDRARQERQRAEDAALRARQDADAARQRENEARQRAQQQQNRRF